MNLQELQQANTVAAQLRRQLDQFGRLTDDELTVQSRFAYVEWDEELTRAAVEVATKIISDRVVATQAELRELGIDPT